MNEKDREVNEGNRKEERRRRKIEEDHEDGCIGRDAATREVRKELRRG